MARLTKKEQIKKRRREIWGVVLLALGLFFGVSLYTSTAGVIGATIEEVSFGIFGMFAYILPVAIFILGILIIVTSKRKKYAVGKIVCTVVLVLSVMSIFHLFYAAQLPLTDYLSYLKDSYQIVGVENHAGGGALAGVLCMPVKVLFGQVGAVIFFVAVILICLILIAKFSPQKVLLTSSEKIKKTVEKTVEKTAEFRENRRQNKLYVETLDQPLSNKEVVKNSERDIILGDPFEGLPDYEPSAKTAEPEVRTFDEPKAAEGEEQVPIEYARVKQPEPSRPQAEEEAPEEVPNVNGIPYTYVKPDIQLLNQPNGRKTGGLENFRENAVILEDTLASFGIKAKVVAIDHGPAVTRYELEPAPGVKVSRIVNLNNDIALKLASSIRIEAPIPGKAAVGIEVPNKNISSVPIREVIESKEFQNAQKGCYFAVGKDIAGSIVISDISKMPHLLVAGATGSGKSVCINSIVISMLYKYSPEEVRILMVDPKVVELNIYNGIPHLLLPVVTDPKKAAGVLKWAVNEMLDRYKVFAQNGVRDIEGYNAYAIENDMDTAPKILVIVDELADLMMAAPNDVEDSICRLAQMGRAAGIHLVIATQRPSVDVITGLIKSNIPSRIAFAVASQIDSRTILDMGGAEKLLGKGDMLYYPSGAPKPIRVQGCFVSDGEVRKVTEFLKKSMETNYNMEILEQIPDETTGKGEASGDQDELLPTAVEIVMESGQASISMLQRRLRVGYARAARLIDEMEVMGIVSGFEGSKPRNVLITPEQYQQMFGNQEE